jgi:hypothetical protein
MLITIRSRRLLKLFGWARYGDRARHEHEWPSSVQATHRLWWRWFKEERALRKRGPPWKQGR